MRLASRRPARQLAVGASAALILILIVASGGYLLGYTVGAPPLPWRQPTSRIHAEVAGDARAAAPPTSGAAAPNFQRAPLSGGANPLPGSPSGAAAAEAAAPGAQGPATAGVIPPGRPVVQFVYFVEQDQAADPGAVALIDHQAQALQRFWFDQFGGTFTLADQVLVLQGDHPAAWYDTRSASDDPRWNRLTNITTETRSRLGLGSDDGSVRLVVYPAARLDGRVGANRYGGAVMDGDDIGCISGEVVTVPYSGDYPANCLPTVAHELGHVFGLSHEGPDQDCMQFGFYQYVAGVKGCQFADQNRIQVRSDPANQGWLAARPGDRAPGRQPLNR